MTRIFLVDDHPIYREGIAARINMEEGLDLCGEAECYRSAFTGIEKMKPDLVITDVVLPDRSGIELIANYLAQHDDTKFLAMSMHDESVYAERVIRAGGRGFLMKTATSQELMEAIRYITSGRLYLSRNASSTLLSRLQSGGTDKKREPFDVLSNRELEVFTSIGLGKNSKEIASDLSISCKTVNTHKDRIRRKLGLNSAHQLFVQAYEFVRSQ